ncbi:BCL-6 corepressor-like protein 1 [Aplochiton taeniatus]
MQVDPTPMNGDESTVSREISALNKASARMVGNPPQTLHPELRDVPLTQQNNKNNTVTDCKTGNLCLDPSGINRSLETPPSQQPNNAPMSDPPLGNSDKRADKRPEVSKLQPDGDADLPTHQRASGAKVSHEDPVSPSDSNVTPKKKPNTQTQSVINLPAGFQCSTLFKPGQPVAFLPATNFSSISKITLPPALGQIAALREATASQFQKDTQPQASGGGGTPLLRTYPYHFSVGRTLAPEKKAATSSAKPKCNSTASNKSSNAIGEHKSNIASVTALPTIKLPIQHPALGLAPPTRFTLSPTAAICCGPALTNSTTQSMLLKHVEKGSTQRGVDKASVARLKPKLSSDTDDHAGPCPSEARDVPLDLSAKSKRQKCAKEPTAAASAFAAADIHRSELSLRDTIISRSQNTTSNSAAAILPNTHRNGVHQKQLNRPLNHQVLEPKSSWVKGTSQDSINNLPGTYVGVASPILASTLRSKDGKGTFADEYQNFAKQELISIIDQGEPAASRGNKPSYMNKGNQHVHGVNHATSTSPAVTQSCPSKGGLSTALPGSTNAHSHQKSGTGKAAMPHSTTVIKPLWQQAALLPHQGASVQRKVLQGTLKANGTTGSEAAKCKTVHNIPSKTESDKWGKIKPPLSNLESIVKQKALETTILTGEVRGQPIPVGPSGQPAGVSLVTGNQNTQSQQTPSFAFPSVTSGRNKDGQLSLPFQADSTKTLNKLKKVNLTKVREGNTDMYVGQGIKASHVSTLNVPKTHVFGNIGSTNGSRMESKLAQELEGAVRKESGLLDSSSPQAKLEGIALSDLTGKCASVTEVQKKAEGTKEGSPTKEKRTTSKQKKPSLKRPPKDKSALGPSKDAGSTKKKIDKESALSKQVPRPKKKKQCAPMLEPILLVDKPSPQSKEETQKNKSRSKKPGRSPLNKSVPDSGNSLQSPETPLLFSSPGKPVQDPDNNASPSPRPKRVRRRVDDGLLDHWGFSAISPQPLPPPLSPPAQPARRPRGRPRTNPRPEQPDQAKAKLSPAPVGDPPTRKKRRRCRNRKYQNGEYITEKDKVEDGEGEERADNIRQGGRAATDSKIGLYPRLSATLTCHDPSTDPSSRRSSSTRTGSARQMESEAYQGLPDKPSGKRKFKCKHLGDSEEQKPKTKSGSLGKRSASFAVEDDSPSAKKAASLLVHLKGSQSPPSNKKILPGKGGASESPPSRPVPPEVRRLIVNKNAGETLLQRAARLGYQEVVLYCLEKDIREVNRRDNAGYTALHEACSRGCTQIVQVLLKHGADVNCSAQDGTRPIHDAVASDNLAVVWMLLNHGADPTLATYSGHTPVKLAQSQSMKTFFKEYFTDLEGRSEEDPTLPWDFFSSSVFETDQEPCWDYLLSTQQPQEEEEDEEDEEEDEDEDERDSERDSFLFEFSSEPLLPCYHIQISITQGSCNWFLLTDVLKRLKLTARTFQGRYPHLEVVSLAQAELRKQVSVSQVSSAQLHKNKESDKEEDEEEEEEVQKEGPVELVRCVPELQRLLGSSIHILQDNEEEEGEQTNKSKPRCR